MRAVKPRGQGIWRAISATRAGSVPSPSISMIARWCPSFTSASVDAQSLVPHQHAVRAEHQRGREAAAIPDASGGERHRARGVPGEVVGYVGNEAQGAA